MVRVKRIWRNLALFTLTFTPKKRHNSQHSRLSSPCTLSTSASHATRPHARHGCDLRLCSATERQSDVQIAPAAPFAATRAAPHPTASSPGARPFSTEAARNRLVLSRASTAGMCATPPWSKEPDPSAPGDAIVMCPFGGVAQAHRR